MSYPICLLQAVTFLDLLAVGLIVPLIPNHVRALGGGHIHVGLLGSIYAGCQLGSGPFIGSLSDLKGRKIIMVLTLFICCMAYVTLGMTTSITVILIMRAVLGLFKQTQMLSRALVPDYEPSQSKQSEIYGRMAAISGVGITLGPVIGGHIAEDFPQCGVKLVSIGVGVCFAANAGLIYFLPNIDSRHIRRSLHEHHNSYNIIHNVKHSIKQSVIELYKVEWSKYWDIFLLKALVAFAMGVYFTSYSIYLTTRYNMSPKYIGYVISFQGVVGTISSFFIGRINNFYVRDEDYSLRNVHVFMLLFIALAGVILSYNIYLYVLWLIPLAIGNAVGRLVSLEMVLKRAHGDHRGTLIGASNSIRSLSGVAAPMVAGLVQQYFGVLYVVYAALFPTLFGLVISYYYRHYKLKQD